MLAVIRPKANIFGCNRFEHMLISKIVKNLFIITIVIAYTRCEPVPTQSIKIEKELILNDHNYENMVGMTQILPTSNGIIQQLENPVIALGSAENLILSFDLLTNKFEYLAARVYHCNKDWSQSVLRDMEFLKEINLYRISDYDFSLNTKTPYINYRFELPKPTLSGNYIISIFRRSNPKDILFNRKFIVVENQSTIEQQVRVSTTVSKREEFQQLDFSVNYGRINSNDPASDLSIVLLQNHDWNTAKTDLRPSLIRPNENYIEFRLLNDQSSFFGGNEFRFFDLRTLDVAGRNVSRINQNVTSTDVFLGLDQPRGNQVYTQNLRDINGNFILENTDTGDVPLNSDYANVTFHLKAPKTNTSIYVVGRFNNWKMTNENQMRYSDQGGYYTTTLSLKQGYYDFQYRNSGANPFELEGSHFQAENDYEIIVYYRKPGNVYDQVIGYKRFNSLNQQ